MHRVALYIFPFIGSESSKVGMQTVGCFSGGRFRMPTPIGEGRCPYGTGCAGRNRQQVWTGRFNLPRPMRDGRQPIEEPVQPQKRRSLRELF